MNEIIVTGIFALIGVSIGGIFTLISTGLSQRNEQKNKDIQSLASQWETFYEIEKELINRIVNLDNTQNINTIKKDVRSLIYNQGYEELDVPSRIRTIKKNWK